MPISAFSLQTVDNIQIINLHDFEPFKILILLKKNGAGMSLFLRHTRPIFRNGLNSGNSPHSQSPNRCGSNDGNITEFRSCCVIRFSRNLPLL